MIDKNIQQFIKQLNAIGTGITIGTPEFDELCSVLSKNYQSQGNKYYFSIDLIQSQLKQYYSASNEKYAYEEIKNYLKTKGFVSRKDTNYLCTTPISQRKVNAIIRDMNTRFPWLLFCAKKFDVTEMKDARIFDALTIIERTATVDRTIDEIENELREQVIQKEEKRVSKSSKTNLFDYDSFASDFPNLYEEENISRLIEYGCSKDDIIDCLVSEHPEISPHELTCYFEEYDGEYSKEIDEHEL